MARASPSRGGIGSPGSACRSTSSGTDVAWTAGQMRAADSISLQGWLRGTASELGPAFSLVTKGHEAREGISKATQGLYPLVTTFCAQELEP